MSQKTPRNFPPGTAKPSNFAEKKQGIITDHPAGEFQKQIPAYAPYALLIIAVLMAYSNVYHNEFLLDDLNIITRNKFLTSWNYAGTVFVTSQGQGSGTIDPFYRPLQSLLYLIVYQSTGLSTVTFHALNIALHALNACLVYILGVRLGFQRVGTLLAALLWALHPALTQAVTYISATAEPLYSTFLLSGILVLAVEFNYRRVLGACALFALALLSKEASVVFPLLTMGLLFYQSANRWSPHTYIRSWPFWLMTTLYLVARATILNFNGFFKYFKGSHFSASMLDRFWTFMATLPTYLRILLWPTGLHMFRSFRIFDLSMTKIADFKNPDILIHCLPVLGGLSILMAALATIVWKPSQRATPISWGMLWAITVLIPVSGVLFRSDALISENWLYLPTAGLALGVGETLTRSFAHVRLQPFRPVLLALAVAVAFLLGTMTFEQNKVWQNPVRFFTHILDCGEHSAAPWLNLGIVYALQGQYGLAIRDYQMALAINNNSADAHYNLGLIMLEVDHSSPESINEGMKHIQRAVELDPDFYRAYEEMARVNAFLGDREKESENRARAVAIKKRLGFE